MSTLKLGAFTKDLKGRSGNTVFSRGPGGVIVKDYIIPDDPKTPLQVAARARMRRVAELWSSLSPDQAQIWRDYALTQGVRRPGTGEIRAPKAQNVFVKLGVRILHVNPQAEIPLTPPTVRFFGDSVAVSAEGEVTRSSVVGGRCFSGKLGDHSEAAIHQSTDSPTTDSPTTDSPTTDSPTADSFSPGLFFTATGPNREGVVTELLTQRLASGACRPYLEKYRSAAFVHFPAEEPSHFIAAEPGWYACAYRFIDAATG
ncbi:MAG TPA: hypothetical protein VEX38_01510, partial [Fimbriimonadaceae bacterium]|nr:hypothetical protein [Fimbriimonadaceae bacterium]